DGIHHAENILCPSHPLVGGAAKPLRSLNVVLRHASTLLIRGTEEVLCEGVALISLLMKTHCDLRQTRSRSCPGGADDKRSVLVWRRTAEKADHRHRRLLRPPHQRPRRRPA